MAEQLTDHFMGSSTVGERGQVVIPAEARERLGIKPGDKLLVFVHPASWGVAFVRFDKLQEAQEELGRVLAGLGEMEEEGGPAESPEDAEQ